MCFKIIDTACALFLSLLVFPLCNHAQQLTPDLKEGANRLNGTKTGRIINGQSLPGLGGFFRETVAITQVTAEMRDVYCGGVIVLEDWVLTAAHCALEYLPEYVIIVAGTLDPSYVWPTEQERGIRRIVIHPNHNKPYLHDNDIAMIQVNVPFKTDPNIQIASFINFDVFDPDLHLYPWIAGWGLDETGVTPKWQRYVWMETMSNEECKEEYAWVSPGRDIDLPDENFCANGREGLVMGTCFGDSGSPLMWRHPVYHWESLEGINSYFYGGDKDCARPNHPSIFVYVNKFFQWISDTGGRKLKGTGRQRACKRALETCVGRKGTDKLRGICGLSTMLCQGKSLHKSKKSRRLHRKYLNASEKLLLAKQIALRSHF